MSARAWIIGLVAASVVEAIAVIMLLLLWMSARGRAEELDERAAIVRDYCKVVRTGLQYDRDHLRDPKRREAASFRFYEGIAGHSYSEIMMCSRHPPDLSHHDECVAAGDYECLAKLADESARAVGENLDN